MGTTMEKCVNESQDKMKALIRELKEAYPEGSLYSKQVCIFVCGSLGRLEMTCTSDLDLFFITIRDEEKSAVSKIGDNLNKYRFFAKLDGINSTLNFKEPSKEGLYWEFISDENLLDIGSRHEDYNNSFTARMLLILESKPVFNDSAYEELVDKIVNSYFIDYKDHSDDFYPRYLMNDILRYWYTLTLNYEYRRDGNDDENKKNWKRLKLKYARKLTCYSMLACLYVNNITPNHVINYIKMTPCERLNEIKDIFKGTEKVINNIIEQYEWFLSLKSEKPIWWEEANNKETAIEKAEEFHKLIHNLMEIVSSSNPNLHSKLDAY